MKKRMFALAVVVAMSLGTVMASGSTEAAKPEAKGEAPKEMTISFLTHKVGILCYVSNEEVASEVICAL